MLNSAILYRKNLMHQTAASHVKVILISKEKVFWRDHCFHTGDEEAELCFKVFQKCISGIFMCDNETTLCIHITEKSTMKVEKHTLKSAAR